MNYAVIMAGGSGKRLWPLSRQSRPKQVLRLFDGQTLLRKCYQRLEGLIDPKNILVLTNAAYVETVRDELPKLPHENIIAEPVVRDTAGAIGLAARVLHQSDPEAVMAVLTADQLLEPPEVFQEAMQRALAFVRQKPEALVTFGIRPTHPSTQFGYIRFDDETLQPGVHRIGAFREKPDDETARRYKEQGNYAWNAGLFVWRCATILDCLRQFVPACLKPLEEIGAGWDGPERQAALKEWFPRLPKISIDYAVMEKASDVYGIMLDCQWYDLGSFAALKEIVKPDPHGNVKIAACCETLGADNNIVVTEQQGHLIALIGVDNLIVAHSPDATLVCPMDQLNRLKELHERIELHGNSVFL